MGFLLRDLGPAKLDAVPLPGGTADGPNGLERGEKLERQGRRGSYLSVRKEPPLS